MILSRPCSSSSPRARALVTFALLGFGFLSVSPADATFHLMQIEQVVGGVCGQAPQQAIQLRQRSPGQNLVVGTRLVVRDATGANPITLLTFPSNVPGAAAGTRILVASPDFASSHLPVPDFTMTNVIPASYLRAGKLSFEDSAGGILWAVAWGGANYTGPNNGTTDNDADGNFGPAFAGILPYNTSRALQFQGASNAPSTTNAANYALTPMAATFINNSTAGAQVLPGCIFGEGFETGDFGGLTAVEP
jgi:hypothetical protein